MQSIVSAEIEDAIGFIDLDISPERTKATNYYKGKLFGDEKEGRSSVVSRDVSDTVQAIMPSLLRVFFGSEHVVEYVPRGPEDVAGAEQATDYVQYLISEDNPGFLVLYDAFKDGLLSKNGIVKFWWDSYEEVKTEDYTGIDESTLAVLHQDRQLEIKITGTENTQIGPVHSVTVTKREQCGRVRIASVPVEEFLIDRRASSIETADLVAHRTMLTVSELLSMGFTEDEIDSTGTDSGLDYNIEKTARSQSSFVSLDDSRNPANKRRLYTEAYMKIQQGEGKPGRLHKICCIGDQFKILRSDPCEETPFASFCPIPEPHEFIGTSIADLVMDIQRIKSQIQRGMLNSLAQSITPRTVVVEGQVNMADVLNNEVGGVIRMRAPGMAQEFNTTFVGGAALPVLQYWDDVREGRTGITKASQGLDADVMQSTTKAAVMATVTAAQQHLEMIARIFAETGMKALFKGLLRIVTRNQDKVRMIRLRNKWVPIDPRAWDATMDVTVNVGLGAGTNDEKVQTLTLIAQKQEAILQTLGPSNPLVTPGQYANTLRKMVELSGFKDSSQFFNSVPADYQPPTPATPPADPQQQAALILAQAQREQIQSDIQKKGAELDLKRQEMMLTDMRERYKIESGERVALAEIAGKYSMAVDKVQADIDRANYQIQHEAIQSDADRQHAAQQATQAQQAQQQQQQAALAAQAQQPTGPTQ